MLLIHPPLVKPCEPPAGIAKLAGCLNRHHIKCTVVDANLEIILDLLKPNDAGDFFAHSPQDTWTARARRHVMRNVQFLTSCHGYGNIDRYNRTVRDINRVIERSTMDMDIRLSLSNYLDQQHSPVSSMDLLKVAEGPEQNPFYLYFKRRLLGLLEDEAPSIVGFSLNYLNQALCTFAMVGFLKRVHPPIRIILGGGLVTSWIKNPAWRNPFKGLVDDLVAGAGEVPLLSILGIKHKGGYDSPDDTVLSKKGYLSPGTILPYSSSRGCYWKRCSFCPEKAEENLWEPEPVESTIANIHNLTAKINPVLVHFLDNAVSPAHLKAIGDYPFGVPWYGFARISSHLQDKDFCMKLRQSGCVMLQIGVESGDQEVLNDMQKGFELKTASAILANLHEVGIAAYVYLIFGTPTETLEKARKTLDFTVTNSRYIRFLNLAIFNLPAYGAEAQKLQTGDFYEGDLSLYRSFLHPKGWNRNLVRGFLDREFKRHPAITPIIRRTPPIFTSNHASFFCADLKTLRINRL